MPSLPDFSSVSMTTVIPIVMAVGAVFLCIQACIGLFTQARTQRIVNRRLQFKETFEGTGEMMVELRKSRGLNADGSFALPVAWFNRLVTQSGLDYRPWRWAGMAIFGGLIATGAAWRAGASPLLMLVAFVSVTLLGPVLVLMRAAKQRSKKLVQQLPDALQVVCRSLEAGHPVPTAIALVAREMPDPVGTEFGMVADEVSYGTSLTDAVTRMAIRVNDADVDLFVATVRLQEKTGGNLCDLLKANTTTIRERQTMRLKVNAASSEGRASAMILTAAPFMVMVAIHLLQPDFYGSVIGSPLIKYGFAILFTWMAIGNLVMRRMINFEI